ncbi:MAG: murein L,D-transpeptidase [Verrucomicrobia bacterium]|nr:murein L,D-transpeptidase [Verrucomicrobiota bacterium]
MESPPVAILKKAPATPTNAVARKPDIAPAQTSRPAPAAPTVAPDGFDTNVFVVQIALASQAISPGSIDGFAGPQTRAALKAFQQREHLPLTGQLDSATKSRLALPTPLVTTCALTGDDLARLRPLSATWLGKSQQKALDFESALELIAEKFQSAPGLIRRLNPSVDWSKVTAGTSLRVPNVSLPPPKAKAASIRIQLSAKTLQAFDERNNLLAHFPCSIAQRVEKRPEGELRVVLLAPLPSYVFDPENFPESKEARELKTKLTLPPGPNNPVGTAWIGLSLPGYGIHGTPNPESVGRTESHGCFRLANWNAEYLLKLVSVGTPVVVEP